jgi:hypothetical protein
MGRPEADVVDDAEITTEERPMPAKTEKQRRFMGAELERKREGKKTRTDMTEQQLEEFASKPTKDKKG